MMAGPAGSDPLAFFFASAIAAKYDKFAWRRRMQSAYSGLAGLLGPCLEGSRGLLFNGFEGSVADVGDVGDCCG